MYGISANTPDCTYVSDANVSVSDVGRIPRKRRSPEKSYRLATFSCDIIFLFLAYYLATFVSLSVTSLLGIPNNDAVFIEVESRAIVYMVLSIGLLLFLFNEGHYTKRITWWSQIEILVKGTGFILLLDGFTSFAFDFHYSLILISCSWIVAFFMLLAGRLLMNNIKIKSDGWKLPTVILADKNTVIDILFALSSDPAMGLDAQTVLLRDRNFHDLEREEFPQKKRNIEIIDAAKNYEDYIRTHPDRFYVISLETFRDQKRNSLITMLNHLGVSFSVVPSIQRVSLYNCEPQYFFGNDVMLLNAQSGKAGSLWRIVKRMIDVVGACVAMALFFIPMLVVAISLKLEGQKGSIFYSGHRVGENGRLFRCWKFRTMDPGTDHLLKEYLANNPDAKAYWDRYFKLPNDPRVRTRTARIIRKLSIDELPQLWNVITGDMSLVGPRPILENEIAAYGPYIREYYRTKPGITGLWQASGRSDTSFQRRVLWDTWYVRNWSLWNDIVIILKTINIVLCRKGAS